MGGIGCWISGEGIAGLKFFASASRKISQNSTGRLLTDWLRNKNLSAPITKLTGLSRAVHRSSAAKSAAQDDNGFELEARLEVKS